VILKVSSEEEVHSISPVTSLVPWEIVLHTKKVEGQNEFKDY